MAVIELIPGKKYKIDIRQGRAGKRIRRNVECTSSEAHILEIKLKKKLGRQSRDAKTISELSMQYIQYENIYTKKE